ncbi:MAG: carboxypeptidase T [Planctomycetota bacterium]|jgi:carboxypeptidase T
MISALFALSLFLPQERAPVLDLVNVELSGRRDRELLSRFATDVDDHFHGRGRARIIADDEEQALLRNLGLRLKIVQEDLSGFYAERASHFQFAGGGSFAGYRTGEEMRLAMVQLSVIYADVVSAPFSIGTSIEGRKIWAIRISDTPSANDASEPLVWFDGLHHAREPISGEAVLRFAEYLAQNYLSDAEVRELVDGRNLLFIPIVNPDGYEFNHILTPSGGGLWRKNMHQNADGSLGVDLNRNYDWEWGPQWDGSSSVPGHNDYRGEKPFSEPESAALRNLALAMPPDLSISCHSYGGQCVLPWGYDSVLTADDGLFRDFASAFSNPLGWTYGPVWDSLYFANGTSVDFQYGTHGTLALAIEIGTDQDGFWPIGPRIGELCNELIPGFMEMARRAGPAPRIADPVWVELLGDGDDWKEPGESWALEVELINGGLLPSTGQISLKIAPSVTSAITLPTAFELAPGEARTEFLSVQFAADAPSNRLYHSKVRLEGEGASGDLSLDLVLGEPKILAFDGAELTYANWEVAGNADGGWERAVPAYVIDSTSGETTQPAGDASSSQSGACWVTGALAGTDSNDNDVDGITRLTSPRFDAHGFEHLQLEYKRWSTSLLQTAVAVNSLTVFVSNNDGDSWTELEIVQHENAWQRVRHNLESKVELTDRMRLRFVVLDDPDAGVTEALLDELILRTVSPTPTLGMWGRSKAGDTPRLFIHAPEAAGRPFAIRQSLSSNTGTQVAGVAGLSYLTGQVHSIASGTLDAEGRAVVPKHLQAMLHLIGEYYHLQVIVDEGGSQAAYSNLLKMKVH